MDKAKEVHSKVIKNRIFVVRRGKEGICEDQSVELHHHALTATLPSQRPREMTSLHMQNNDILMDFPSSREGEERRCLSEPRNQELNSQQASYPVI